MRRQDCHPIRLRRHTFGRSSGHAGCRPLLAALLVVFGSCPFPVAVAGQADGSDTSCTTFFPQQRLFPKLLADGTAQQLSLNKDMQTRRWVGGIGGSQRVFQWRLGTWSIQAGVGATVYASLIRKPQVLQVVTADFFVDFPIDIQLNDWISLRTGWGHHSGHLVDDGIEILNLHSVNYAKDYVPIFAALKLPSLGGFVYGGTRIDYHSIPERSSHWVLQGGIEGGNILITPVMRAYAAIDVKVKSEAGWGTTQSYQLGMKMWEEGANDLRVAYTYRTGLDDRGQFYKQHVSISLMGVYVDF